MAPRPVAWPRCLRAETVCREALVGGRRRAGTGPGRTRRPGRRVRGARGRSGPEAARRRHLEPTTRAVAPARRGCWRSGFFGAGLELSAECASRRGLRRGPARRRCRWTAALGGSERPRALRSSSSSPGSNLERERPATCAACGGLPCRRPRRSAACRPGRAPLVGQPAAEPRCAPARLGDPDRHRRSPSPSPCSPLVGTAAAGRVGAPSLLHRSPSFDDLLAIDRDRGLFYTASLAVARGRSPPLRSPCSPCWSRRVRSGGCWCHWP